MKKKVRDLKAGDRIRTSSQGVFTIIGLIRVFEQVSGRTMYNFETDSPAKRFCCRGGASVDLVEGSKKCL